MKEERNIEEYFRKKIQEESILEEDWNVPSDDVFESAKPFFPKKKKRRGFFFLLLFVGAIGAGTLFFINSNRDEINSNIAKTETERKVNINNSTSATMNSSEVESVEKINQNESEVIPLNVITDSRKEIQEKKSVTNSEKNVSNKAVVLNADNIEKIKEKVVTQEVFGPKNKTQSIGLTESLVSKENIKETEFEVPDLIQSLAIKSDWPIANVSNEAFKPEYTEKLWPDKRPINKWEVGLSYSQLLLINEAILNDDEDLAANEELRVDVKNISANLMLTRRLNKKWSLSSGATYFNPRVLLEFEVEEIYDNELGDASFRRVTKDKTPVGSISVNEESVELDVKLKSGVILNDGEKLSINGSIPLNMKAFQIPFLLNLHLGKKYTRFETILNTGFSVDIYNLKVDNVDFNIYRNNELISEPLNIDPLNITELGFSVYLGAGFKYHLTENWNVGVQTRFDVSGFLLSRCDFGIYYGF